MSEETLAAVAAPFIQEAVKELEPAAKEVLATVRAFVAGEADRVRTELPGLAEQAAEHVHAVASGVLAHYQAVTEHIDAVLAGHTPTVAPDPTAASPATPTTAPAP
jgi:uncharacterized protein YdhG (YjbR/CyaY superfamily)